MAKLEHFVPFLIRWEAGVIGAGLTNEQLFEKARAKGYGNDPVDSGGPTMVGVTLTTYKSYCREKGLPVPGIPELRAIPYEQWFDLVKTMFWDHLKADEINNQSLAELCVDTVWGSGTGYIKNIQKVIGVTPDGTVGPKTLKKLNQEPCYPTFQKLWMARKEFFEQIVANSIAAYEKKLGHLATEQQKLKYTKKKFLRGWMNRLNSLVFTPTDSQD